MSGYWQAPDDYAESWSQGSGSAHAVSGDQARELPEDAVRRVAEEVTHKTFTVPKRPMGFL